MQYFQFNFWPFLFEVFQQICCSSILFKSNFNGLQLNIGFYVKMNKIFVRKIYTLLNIERKLAYK